MSQDNLCCLRFSILVREKIISNVYQFNDELDETEWATEDLGHLYYCPFCGEYIKGRGFGDYDKEYVRNRTK